MPVEEEVLNLLLEHCKKRGLYYGGRWTSMSASEGEDEVSMHEPIRIIGQCIHAAVQDGVEIDGAMHNLKKIQHKEEHERVDLVKGVWNALPSRVPHPIGPYCDDALKNTRSNIDFAIPSEHRPQLSAEIDRSLENLKVRVQVTLSFLL